MARRRGYRRRKSGFPVFEFIIIVSILAFISPRLLDPFFTIILLVIFALVAVAGLKWAAKQALQDEESRIAQSLRREPRLAAVPERDFYPTWRTSTEKPSTVQPEEWSLQLLRMLEWKRFEEVATAYYRMKGYDAEATCTGADGGVDIVIKTKQDSTPFCIVQCKAFHTRQVGVKPVRELLGVMSARDIKLGVFMTTSEFTGEARELASANNIKLINGREFLDEIQKLAPDDRKNLLLLATEGDFTTPTCVSCNVKMTWRDGGAYKPFWGCVNYPRCKNKLFAPLHAELA